MESIHQCRPICLQVLNALDGSHRSYIYWTEKPLPVFGFDFDNLNALKIKYLDILDSFLMMNVRDLLHLPEEQVLPFLGNTHLFSFCIIRCTTLYFPNPFHVLFADKWLTYL